MPPVPSVSFQKVDLQTGSVPTSTLGILAVIAPATAGPVNMPQMFQGDSQIFSTFGPSPLTEDCSYTLARSGNPVIADRATASQAASYGSIASSLTGSSAVTAGSAAPADNYEVLVKFVVGGTVGTAGIQYTYSLDGGNTVSAVQALGTASVLTIPNFAGGGSPGVSFNLSAGTINTNDSFSCNVQSAAMSNADVATALTALGQTTLPWEGVLVDMATGISTGTVAVVDSWLQSIEKIGKFRFAVLNTRLKNQQIGESESAYLTAMTTLCAGSSISLRLCVGADGGAVASTLTGLLLPRPTSLILAADAMSIPIGQDPAWVGAGSLTNVSILGPNASPAYHNEELSPGLDALLLSTLRSVNGEGANAVFITNANVFSQAGSDYVFLPQIRVLNAACEVAYSVLTKALGLGVGKKPKDPNTGIVSMLDADRLAINDAVTAAVVKKIKGQASGMSFALATNDDLSSNQGATVNATMNVSCLAYIKGVKGVVGFSKTFQVSLGPS
jgi:hypothetical protein